LALAQDIKHTVNNLGLLCRLLAYSAAMDFTLALLPWKLLWNLQMVKKEKLGVAVAMGFGFM